MIPIRRFPTLVALFVLVGCQHDAVSPLPGARFSKISGSVPPADPAIAFITSAGGLSVMNADGSNQTVIVSATKTTTANLPSWSPDAKSIVFQGTIGGVGGLWIIEVAVVNGTPVGSNLRHLQINFPAGTYVGCDPEWAPLGDVITVCGSSGQIYSVPPTGGDPTVVYTPAPGRLATWSALSPDGSKLVLGEDSTAGAWWSLLAYDRTTSTADTILPLSSSFFVRSPAWSRDGGMIAFSGYSGSNPEAVYTVPFTGTPSPSATPVSVVGGGFPTWSPDDSKIAFMGGSGHTKGVLALTLGTGATQLLASGGSHPAWRRF